MDQMQIYQQIILDHNKKPRNFRVIDDCTHSSEGFNPLCGDRITVELKVNSEQIVEDVAFQGDGCAISRASASMMTTAAKGKHVDTVTKIFASFQSLMKGTELSDEDIQTLGKIKVFSGVCRFPTRIKCANLAWHTMKAALGEENSVSTE